MAVNGGRYLAKPPETDKGAARGEPAVEIGALTVARATRAAAKPD
jgi:hypothetical protein